MSIRDRAAEDLRSGALAITCNLFQALCNAFERLNYRPYRPDNKNPKGSDYGINDCGDYHFWLLPCRLISRGHYVTRSLGVHAPNFGHFRVGGDPPGAENSAENVHSVRRQSIGWIRIALRAGT